MNSILEDSNQIKIIEYDKNCVVIAKPGSGKTFVLCEKIKRLVPKLKKYQAVIAISYTNKASKELQSRCIRRGIDTKKVFFGTIDRFCINEIIIPFGKQIFGLPLTKEMEIKRLSEISDSQVKMSYNETEDFNEQHISFCKDKFISGQIVLDFIGPLANYLFDKSIACRRYLKSRYTHLMIDEYQDSGYYQHNLFISLKKIGLIAIAVGDSNQSIFAFSNKSSKYLISLSENPEFKLFPLDFNHRSHPSIMNYATCLLQEFSPSHNEEINVFYKLVNGSEIELAKWLNLAIPFFAKKYNVSNMSKIGILTKSNRSGKLISKNLNIKNRYFIPTPLDEEASRWSNIFIKVLTCLLDKTDTSYELLEELIDIDYDRTKKIILFNLINRLKKLNIEKSNIDIEKVTDLFCSIAEVVAPSLSNIYAIDKLKQVLSTKEFLYSFGTPYKDEVQIMSLHKSKGSEFELIFHLDLYEYILPNNINGDFVQDLNLHYVGITRASKACILCTSTARHKACDQKITNAKPSQFLNRNNLIGLRLNSPI